jgi:putative multiple sugar transport system permease protein
MALILKTSGRRPDGGHGTSRDGAAEGGFGRTTRSHLGGHLRENGMLVALSPSCSSSRWSSGRLDVDFLSAQNITNLFLQNSYVIIMALGMLLVIVSGHIDLSVGSVAAFTGAIAAVLTVTMGLPVWIGDPGPCADRRGPDRRGAGLLGRLLAHPVLHRDPGGDAGVPRPHALASGGQNIGPFPRSSRRCPPASCRHLRRLGQRPPGLERRNSHRRSSSWWSWRRSPHLAGPARRARDAEFGITPEPAGLLLGAQHAVVAAALIFVGWKLAQLPRPAERADRPVGPDGPLRLHHREHGDRAGASTPRAATRRRRSCRASSTSGCLPGASSTWASSPRSPA